MVASTTASPNGGGGNGGAGPETDPEQAHDRVRFSDLVLHIVPVADSESQVLDSTEYRGMCLCVVSSAVDEDAQSETAPVPMRISRKADDAVGGRKPASSHCNPGYRLHASSHVDGSNHETDTHVTFPRVNGVKPERTGKGGRGGGGIVQEHALYPPG